jgi:hypothetical protein
MKIYMILVLSLLSLGSVTTSNAKCINSTHKKPRGNTREYVCQVRSGIDSTKFRSVPDKKTKQNKLVCVGCGCSIGAHTNQ